MTGQSRTFRVFVSSTFADMAAERNVLQESTFPRLREYCRERGASFQAIDLRWGVSSEASLDQQTMNICLGEIRRCQEITPRPNFVVLLGQRYGWLPPPPQVRANVFERILNTIKDDDDDGTRELLGQWYRRDDNAVAAEYVLLPRDPDGPYAEHDHWQPVAERLQEALCQGAAQASGLTGDDLLPFCASATHQEIAAGALKVEKPEDKVLCVFRKIEGFPTDAKGRPTDGAEQFVDADQSEIEALKGQLRRIAPNENVVEPGPAAQWSTEDRQPTAVHLEALADVVYEQLCAQIARELDSPTEHAKRQESKIQQDDGLDAEGRAHHEVAEGHLTHFVGRVDVLERVATYLDDPDGRPLVICGEGGTGKSALLSKVIEKAQALHPEAQIVFRFIGATPEASSSRSLLLGLSRELCRRGGEDESAVPEDENKLVENFRERLEATDTPPLILILDALDQLAESDSGRNLAWLPLQKLPAQVCLIMTTRPGEIEESLRRYRQAIIEPLDGISREEGQTLINLWLRDAGRTLQPDPEQPGISSGQLASPDQRTGVMDKFAESQYRPLYLRLAFEEARLWRSWEEPESLAVGVEGIIRDNLFVRLSREQHHGEMLVSHAMGYLAASRYGLAEDELLAVLSRDPEVYATFLDKSHHLPPDLIAYGRRYRERQTDHPISNRNVVDWLQEIRRDRNLLRDTLAELCGSKGPQLPMVLLARLRADLDPYLTTRISGNALLLDFYHRELENVSTAKFVAGQREACHGGLARYFLSTADPEGDRTWTGERRALAELPYHVTWARDWDKLIGEEEHPGVLCDLRFIEAKCTAGLTYELARDYNVALDALPELREEREADRAARRRCADYVRALADYVRRRREGEEVSLPDPPPTCEPSQLLDPEKAEAAVAPDVPTRANRLRRFGGFYFESSHAIASHPDWTLLVAGSYGGSGIVFEQARALFCQIRSLWLERRPGSPLPPLHSTCLAVLQGHTLGVETVAASADFLQALSGSLDRTLRLWDLERGECRSVLQGHTAGVREAVASTDFCQALSGSDDGTLRLWDLDRGECRAVLEGHTSTVEAVAASADFRQALSGSDDGTLRLWDLDRRECLSVLEGHTSTVEAVAASADFRQALSGSDDGTLRLWDLERGECRAVLKGHTRRGYEAVAASADFRQALSGSSDLTLQTLGLWDIENGKCLTNLRGHTAGVEAVAAGADFRRALSGSSDKILRLWDQKRGECRGVLQGHTAGVRAVSAGADFRRALSGSSDRTLRLWDLERGECRAMLQGHFLAVRAVSASADFRKVLSGGSDFSLRLWDLERGKCWAALEGQAGAVEAVSASADFRQALSGSSDRILRLWDLERGECQSVLRGHTSGVEAVAVRADFRRALSGSSDRTLRLWDLERGECQAVLEGHTGTVEAVAASADFRQAISGSSDRTLRLWDLDRGECQAVLEGHTAGVWAVAAGADFRQAISGSSDRTLRLWDLERGECRAVLEGHTGTVEAVAASADFRQAISGSSDRTLRLWDLDRREYLTAYYSGARIFCVVADFARGRFACGCSDGQVHFLNLRRGSEIVCCEETD